jgi:menaquinone-dependent protoporphyrinogen IX oxidase
MWMTKGPTNTSAEIEYTDWDKVKRFGLQLKDM